MKLALCEECGKPPYLRKKTVNEMEIYFYECCGGDCFFPTATTKEEAAKEWNKEHGEEMNYGVH